MKLNRKNLRFTVEGQPELSAALNLLAEEIEKKETLRFSDTRHIKARIENGIVSFDLFDLPDSVLNGTGAALNPWQPVFFTEGTPPSLTYKCRFNLGTANNVPATNWNDAFTLPSDTTTYKFVVITLTAASGKITGVTLSVDTSPPTEDVVSEDVPPTTFKIVLGAIGRSTAKMIITRNLQLEAQLLFLKSKPAPAVGAEAFARWWRWHYEQD